MVKAKDVKQSEPNPALHEKLLIKLLHVYWRLTRSLTCGAQGLVVDDQNRVLLIRHTYRSGWHFPGGGVEKNETFKTALTRELREEANVVLTGPIELVGIFSNFRLLPSDHIALFKIRHWQQPEPPKPSREIAAHGFFDLSDLPPDIHPSTRQRLKEVFEDVTQSETW